MQTAYDLALWVLGGHCYVNAVAAYMTDVHSSVAEHFCVCMLVHTAFMCLAQVPPTSHMCIPRPSFGHTWLSECRHNTNYTPPFAIPYVTGGDHTACQWRSERVRGGQRRRRRRGRLAVVGRELPHPVLQRRPCVCRHDLLRLGQRSLTLALALTLTLTHTPAATDRPHHQYRHPGAPRRKVLLSCGQGNAHCAPG